MTLMKTSLVMILFSVYVALFAATSQFPDIEGIDVRQKMTADQIIEKLGKPTIYRTSTFDDGTPLETFYYNRTFVRFTDGYLSEFIIVDKRFKVLTNVISGGVSVGDSFTKISFLKPEVATWLSCDNDIYYIPMVNGEINVFFKIDNGIITNIHFSSPV